MSAAGAQASAAGATVGLRSPGPQLLHSRRVRWAAVLRRRVEPQRVRERQLAEALRVIASATRTGATLGPALAEAGERTTGTVSGACTGAAAQLCLGVSPAVAVRRLADGVGSSSARLFADVLEVQHRRGGDLGALCHRLAQLLHERGRLADEARSLTAQARFAARAVVVVPALVAVLWAWSSPQSMQAMLTPTMLLVASPAFVLLGIGMVIVRAMARSAVDHERRDASSAARARRGPVQRLLSSCAGTGGTLSQCIRLSLATGVLTGGLAAVSASGVALVSGLVAVGCAAAWPAAQRRRRQRELADVAASGIVTLLELSIALLEAGATPRELFVAAIEGCSEPLRSHLAPACAQVALGRDPVSALQAVAVVHASSTLDAWMQAVASGDRYGLPIAAVLDTLLRDARTAERERFRTRATIMAPRMQLATVLLIVPGVMWLVLAATTNGLVRQLAEAGILGG